MTSERSARTAEAGRACPYCRFALKSGIPVVDCAACSAVHHAECWADNGGCAIVGCAGGPGQAGAFTTPGAASKSAAAVPAPAAEAPAPVSRRRARTPMLVAGATAIAAVASAGTVLLVGDDDGDTTRVASTNATPQPYAAVQPTSVDGPTVSVTTVPSTTPATSPPTTSTATTPTRGAAQREAAIQTAISSYFRAIRAGGFDRAWRLLSPTYRAWKVASGGGFDRWRQQEGRNMRQLRRGEPVVSVRSYDPVSNVATVYVSGLRFKPQGLPECDYLGITWARKVAGRWLYDQGYAQNAARAAKWRPRQSETLGSSCDTSGY